MNEVGLLQPSTINDVCRLCANFDENMVSIYSDEGADHMLENKIKMHLPFINICKNDVLPKKICYQCASTVLVWNELYECCSNANQKLRYMFEVSQFDQSNSKIISYDDIEGMDVPVKNFIGESIVYEEISDNIFNKDEKINKTLIQLEKNPGTSKTDLLSQVHKSPVIQEEDSLNTTLKSKISDIFDRDDDDDSDMYLNAAGIDDEMNGLLDCHQLNMSVTDDCDDNLVVKQEYLSNVMEDDVNKSEEMSDSNQQHCSDGEINVTAIADNEHAVMLTDGDDDSENFKQIRSIICDNNVIGVVKLLENDDIIGDENENEDVGDDENDDRDVVDDNNEEDEENPIIHLNMGQLYMSQSQNTTMILNDENDENDEEIDEDDDDPNPDHDDQDEHETMCQICATVFKTRYNLLRHFQKRHPEYKMYECDLCRISFPSIDEFKDHLEEQHSKVHTTHTLDSKQVRFACDVCGNMYKNKASAMNHLLTHTAKKTVHCSQCEFTCYTKQQLGVHQTKHDKRFVCDICNKRFAQKSQLDVHINAVHYNQRPYVCVLCKKSFKTKGSHDAHMIVHTDTRNYACPYCEKKCRKRYDLTLHIRTHTGEKPFKCSVCGRGFVQMCDTRKHEMLHFKPGKRKGMFYSSQDVTTAVDDE